MYFSKNILNKTIYGRKVIKSLFAMIKKKPSKFLKKENINKQSIERSICDFIAGMTDRFAINLYKSKK
jgi:dGTPase